jgi:hypothetical protein
MNGLNDAFYYVANKIIDLQQFFISTAWSIGRVVFLIALLSAGFNYALTGSGLKENVIKIGKAVAFFLIVIFAYPNIISFMTSWTFGLARDSLYPSIEAYYADTRDKIASAANEYTNYVRGVGMTAQEYDRYLNTIGTGRSRLLTEISKSRGPDGLPIVSDPIDYFLDLLHTERNGQMNYTTVAPAAVLRVVLVIAESCFSYADSAQEKLGFPDFGKILKGLICAFFIILTGVFAVLEYLIAFLEFMLVASVGIILLPLSIWDGSKFMSEKFIGAILGFFIKLLFCNLAIFLMLYGFVSLSHQFAQTPFSGGPDEFVVIVFTCLMFFFICKSAPALAQSLLTGTPSLSATGAISAATGAVAAAGAVMGVGRAVAGGAMKAAIGGHGAIAQAGVASEVVKQAGGDKGDQRRAFWGSMAGSAVDTAKAVGHDLSRSLMGSGGSGGGSSGGLNPHSWQQQLMHAKTNGENRTIDDYTDERKTDGAKEGIYYTRKHNLDIGSATAAASDIAGIVIPAYGGSATGVGGLPSPPSTPAGGGASQQSAPSSRGGSSGPAIAGGSPQPPPKPRDRRPRSYTLNGTPHSTKT